MVVREKELFIESQSGGLKGQKEGEQRDQKERKIDGEGEGGRKQKDGTGRRREQ